MMKIKNVHLYGIMPFFGLAMLLNINAISQEKATFIFQKKFESMTIKHKLKLVRDRDLDGFDLPLDECLQNFYKDTLGKRTYELEDRERRNKIAVSEYVFKDTIAASNAFNLAYRYAESVRKTRLQDWNTLCYNLPIPQIYYASKNGAHVYLYTTLYKFLYRSKENRVDDIMERDKGILLDNFYRQMSMTE